VFYHMDGSKYDGMWREDKKNGLGISSRHQYRQILLFQCR